MRTRVFAIAAGILCLMTQLPSAHAQKPPSQVVRVADAAMKRWPDGASPNWDFTLGVELAGINAAWQQTQNKAYLAYLQHVIDLFVQPDGTIRTYKTEDYSLNNILLGRQLLLLHWTTKQEKYAKAAAILRNQLATQPHTASGGFWHTAATPNLMLLDDLYMFAPFWAEYAKTFNPKDPRADTVQITKQFVLLEQHARELRTGLLYHGWDESKKAQWSDPKTGVSPNVWARGMGWYMMALVDTLQYYDTHDSNRAVLLGILNRTAESLLRKQDAQTGLWYQLIDKPEVKENYIESSSVIMLTYALERGVHLGYLPKEDATAAQHAWKGIQERFVKTASDGSISLSGTVTGIAMGAVPANDGSDGYYLHAPVVSDDPKGIGPFLMLAAEMEKAHR